MNPLVIYKKWVELNISFLHSSVTYNFPTCDIRWVTFSCVFINRAQWFHFAIFLSHTFSASLITIDHLSFTRL